MRRSWAQIRTTPSGSGTLDFFPWSSSHSTVMRSFQAVSANNGTAFRVGCETSDASLRAAIRHVEDFGVYVEETKPAPVGRGDGRSGGVTQNFNGPVTFHAQAIATDNAIQKIEHMGNTTGSSLKEMQPFSSRARTSRRGRSKKASRRSRAWQRKSGDPRPGGTGRQFSGTVRRSWRSRARLLTSERSSRRTPPPSQ